MDAAEDLVRPLQDRPVRVDRETLTPRLCRRLFQLPAPCGEGRAGLTGSTPARSWSSSADARMVGGQEDMIIDVALDMVKQRDAAPAS